jgi:hypothetical protein
VSYTFFGVSQFHTDATRYWFEKRNKWPLPIYQAEDYIKQKDPEFFALLSKLPSPQTPHKDKIEAMEKLRDMLFPLV